MVAWTDEETQFIRENRQHTATHVYRLWQEKYGDTRSFPSIEHKVLIARRSGPPAEVVLPEPAETRVDAGFEWLESVIAAANKTSKPKPLPESGDRTRVLFLSDLHFGQEHEMFGSPFNADVARDRLLDIPNKLPTTKPDKLIVAFGGDCVEGENIYPNQQVHIRTPAITQAQQFAAAAWEMLVRLQKHYKCSVEAFTVPGNHGHTGKQSSELSNWDNVGYLLLQTMSSMYDGDISVHYNPTEFCVFEAQGRVVLMNHHGVKHTGTPATRTKLAGWRELFGFDVFMNGHWHEAKVGQWFGKYVICNGSLGGVNQYATKLAVGSPAQQVCFDVVAGEPIRDFSLLTW